MKTVKTILPVGKVVEIKELPDGRIMVVQEEDNAKERLVPRKYKGEIVYDRFIRIDPKSLSLKDKFIRDKISFDYFMEREKYEFRRELEIMLTHGMNMECFYAPVMAPSLTDDGEGIQFVAGKKPLVKETLFNWNRFAKRYYPAFSSRIGTGEQYTIFYATIIKKLVDDGVPVKEAWEAICGDPTTRWSSFYSSRENTDVPLTGSDGILGFYDLPNTYKLVYNRDYLPKGFGICGTDYRHPGPLTHSYFYDIHTSSHEVPKYNLSAWIVLS